MHTYMLTYVRTYVRMYVLYVPMYIRRYVHDVCKLNLVLYVYMYLLGTDNSKSTPKLLEFWYDRPMESGESEITKCVKKLPYELRDLMPDHEYMVRCGWLPNGEW